MGDVDYGKTARFGGALGITTYLLAWLIGFFIKNGGQPQATLDFVPTLTEGVKNSLVTGINTDFASQLLGWVSGVSPFNLWGLLVVAIAGMIIAVVGAFIVDVIKNNALGKFINKTMLRKIVGIAVIGSLAVGFLVTLFAGNAQLPAFWATITMVIYFAIVAFVYRGLQTLFGDTNLGKQLLVSP